MGYTLGDGIIVLRRAGTSGTSSASAASTSPTRSAWWPGRRLPLAEGETGEGAELCSPGAC